jgi:radial spoke head protein 1
MADEEPETIEVTALPEMWRYTKSENMTGPRVGKLLKFLNDIEEQEEFDTRVQERNPENGQNILMWATLNRKFVLVEWLLKRGGRNSFAFSNATGDITIYDKWVEVRKEIAERERERLENPPPPPDEGDAPEEAEPEKKPHELVTEALGDSINPETGKYQVQAIGNLGVYQGVRDESGNKCSLGQGMYVNGDCYIGEYNANTRHGVGTYWWLKAGMIYTGDWRENLRSGVGRMVYSDGSRYFGSWSNDKRNGQGQYTYPNGDTYTGEWIDDIKNGQGTLTFAKDGSKYTGEYVDGSLTHGEWTMPCGTRYFGTFRNSKPFGNGIFGFVGGFFQEGVFTKQGEWVPGKVHAQSSKAVPTIRVGMRDASLSKEAAGGGLSTLLEVLNSRATQNWLREHSTSSEPLQIRAVSYDKKQPLRVVGARVKLSAETTLNLCLNSTVLLVVLYYGQQYSVLWVSDANPLNPELSSLRCPHVSVTPAGVFTGDFIDQVCNEGKPNRTFSLPLRNKNTTFEIARSLKACASNASKSYDIRLFLQPVEDKYSWDTLQQRVSACDNAVRMVVTPVNEAMQITNDAGTLYALLLFSQMVGAGTLPRMTSQPQRPATPPPPTLLMDLPAIEAIVEPEKPKTEAAEDS